MKIANSGMSTVVASEGVQTTSAFNIARTPHMFNILSSGLYSDKIGAVLREISCNAMDAHIMGDCRDKPFQVKMPSSLDRSFYVKDWGPGLDDHEIRELYSTYGWSSKQDNDDVTGAFGLGSKSPFAYTMQNDDDADGFTVESTKNGIKRIYTCYIGDSGAPSISRLFEGPADADWPHGVKVMFPVQERDIPEFHEKAREILRWFAVLPEVLGLNSKLPVMDFKMQGSFFAMGPRDTPDRGACLIMGNVRYPLNAGRIRDLSVSASALLSSGIHLWVPMGTVMMTPSREELEYTDRTRSGIKTWLEKAALEVAIRLRDDVMTEEPTRWAWFKKIQEYYGTLPFGISAHLKDFLKLASVSDEEIKTVLEVVSERVAKLPIWTGDGITGPARKYLEGLDGRYQRDDNGEWKIDTTAETRGCRVWAYAASEGKSVKRREVLRGSFRQAETASPAVLSFVDNVCIFYADGKQADARVRNAVSDGSYKVAFLVIPCRGTDMSFAKTYAEKMVDKENLDGAPCAPVTSLEVPSAIEENKLRRKLNKDKTPRELFSATAVKFVGLNGNVEDVTLGELEDTDMFYICASNLGQYRREKWFNKNKDQRLDFHGNNKSQVLKAIADIITLLDLPVSGAIVVETEGKARRLKLEEQGCKEFLPFIRDAILATDNWELLTKDVSRTPTVNFKELWMADDYGILGLIGHHRVINSEFWKKFDATPELGVLKNLANLFVDQSNQAVVENTSAVIAQSALISLASHLYGSKISTDKLGKMACYEVKAQFHGSHPMLCVMNEGILSNWMKDTPELAITALTALCNIEPSLRANLVAVTY